MCVCDLECLLKIVLLIYWFSCSYSTLSLPYIVYFDKSVAVCWFLSLCSFGWVVGEFVAKTLTRSYKWCALSEKLSVKSWWMESKLTWFTPKGNLVEIHQLCLHAGWGVGGMWSLKWYRCSSMPFDKRTTNGVLKCNFHITFCLIWDYNTTFSSDALCLSVRNLWIFENCMIKCSGWLL